MKWFLNKCNEPFKYTSYGYLIKEFGYSRIVSFTFHIQRFLVGFFLKYIFFTIFTEFSDGRSKSVNNNIKSKSNYLFSSFFLSDFLCTRLYMCIIVYNRNNILNFIWGRFVYPVFYGNWFPILYFFSHRNFKLRYNNLI